MKRISRSIQAERGVAWALVFTKDSSFAFIQFLKVGMTRCAEQQIQNRVDGCDVEPRAGLHEGQTHLPSSPKFAAIGDHDFEGEV
jgi:hypothetical protein